MKNRTGTLTTQTLQDYILKGHTGFSKCHMVQLTQLTYMLEMVNPQMACTKEHKKEDMPITQHHLHNQIQIVTNDAFTIECHPGQVIGFTVLIHMTTQIMLIIPLTLLLTTQKHHNMQEAEFIGDNLLSPGMIEQTIIQAALAFIEMFNGTKSKFEAWTEPIKMQHKYQVKFNMHDFCYINF